MGCAGPMPEKVTGRAEGGEGGAVWGSCWSWSVCVGRRGIWSGQLLPDKVGTLEMGCAVPLPEQVA